MARQLVRLSDIRSPLTAQDGYTSAQIQDAEKNSVSAEDYLQYVLSQIRLIQGTTSWKQPPAADLGTMGSTLAELQAAVAQIGPLGAQIAALSAQVAAARDTYATQAALAAATQALATLGAQAAAKTLALSQEVAQAQATLGQQAVQIAALEAPKIAPAPLYDQPLQGLYDGKNCVFLTGQVYARASLRVYCNGLRWAPGPAHDYVAAESRPGQGYNQVVINSTASAPGPQDRLTADFAPA